MPDLTRRGLAGSLLATAGLAALPLRAQGPATGGALTKITEDAVPIGAAERLQRIAKAQTLMRARGLGAVLIEPGASLDYFTGVQWHRSERLTAAVLPAEGEPIIVTPYFEEPSVRESLSVPAEVRTWNEHESPFALVAGALRDRKVADRAVGVEETVRYFAVDGLGKALNGVRIENAAPVVRACRMIKSAAELALMQKATDVTLAAYRHTWPRVEKGMTPAEIGKIMNAATVQLGGSPEFALVLLGEASAYPHGSGKPQQVREGEVVLMDCGCTVHGYQSDVSRTFVFGAPTVEQRKVWNEVRQGQEIAFRAARIGASAGSVDDAVRAQYQKWGYGPGYRLPGLSHRTGHGIGLEGHEPVNFVHGEETLLQAGMCFSNEPGLYAPGKFGIRLEDCLYMTPQGPRWFSEPPPSIDRPLG
ncbi:Xaa-Pro peptidase family protein [Sphingosinicella sp. BN140058]|uniref:M24 family metallopeptidase n=1 Tax=Sphingosinicella sp. BN140058 TaxID=1892855 RepID=UPI001012C073|nr:Xaa-Pro peptidase family protein [Sphingosinicella sp. BN140058]QAY80094.1 aminopeptidase P family protein [Sphingosinicella sp. BN140058]